MKKPLIAVSIALVMAGGFAGASVQAAAVPTEGLAVIRRIAIQHNGRHKPFDSFAWETLSQITGAPAVGGEDPVVTVLGIIADADHWQQVTLVSVPFVPLREALGMDRKATRISYNDLVASRKLMRLLPPIVQKQQRDEKLTMLENETMDAFQRFVALNALLEQKLELVPAPGAIEGDWVSVTEPHGYPPAQQAAIRGAWQRLVAALRAGQGSAAAEAAAGLATVLHQANPAAQPAAWRIELEIFYNRARPFHGARALYLLACIGLIWSLMGAVPRVTSGSFVLLVAAYVFHAIGILLRVVIGGRPPVSNFFETMLWLPFVAVTVSLIFERVYRAKYFGIAGALLGALVLWLADYVPLDSSISPVVAVLHSNLWLTVHVLTIVASYGAIALAVGLAHIYGWLYLVRGGRGAQMKELGRFIYRALQVGVVLLAGGIMLGAVWANASWGRYWGWDPKETWALITLLWYLALLHGRFAGWINGVGVALATIGGFFLLLMTYYGVSFYLVGLHSYAGGNAKPLPALLVAYLIAEAAFLAVVGLTALRRRPA